MNKRINNAKKGVKPNKAKALSCLMALLLLLSLYGCSKQETGSAVTSSNVIAEVDIPEEDGLAEGEALNREDVESIGETTEPGYGVTGSDVTDEATDDTTIEEGETPNTIIVDGQEMETVGSKDWSRMSQEEAQAVLDAGKPNISDYGYDENGAEAYAEAWSQYYGAMCETGQIDWGDGSWTGGKYYYDPYECAKAEAKLEYNNYVAESERLGLDPGQDPNEGTMVRLEDGTEVTVKEYMEMMGIN